jgi:hypothetical protein
MSIANENLLKESLLKLFPDGSAWESRFRNETDFNKFIDGISKEFARAKEKSDQIPLNFFPETTELLEEWIQTFAMPENPLLTDTQERARLEGHWRGLSKGSMQSANMEEIFALSGFNIRARILTTGEDPRDFFIGTGKGVYGRATAEYGDQDTRYGNIDATEEAKLVVNCFLDQTIKIMRTMYGKTNVIYGSNYLYGESDGYIREPVEYQITDDDRLWGMYYVIEGPTGDPVQIQANLKDTFDLLICLTKPVHMHCIVRSKIIG